MWNWAIGPVSGPSSCKPDSPMMIQGMSGRSMWMIPISQRMTLLKRLTGSWGREQRAESRTLCAMHFAHSIMKLQARKILVMRYRFIGDTVLTVPFLRNLRQAYPAAQIDLMLEPFSGQVIEGCPYVDNIVPFEFRTIHTYSSRSKRSRLSGYLHYRRLIASAEYDAVFVLKRSLSSALLVWAGRVPRRIGFTTEGRGMLLTDPVPYRQDQHEVQNFLDCLRAVQIPVAS
ncbi:MAG TPA: hypothetical protein DCS05_11710, partial [Nitrospiraceae bacterium]|nr:hypothetical protein [Nitrospiraceae bacterium]